MVFLPSERTSVLSPIMSEMPRVKYPGEPTRSATLLYTEPMMFMFTVLPLRQAWGKLETYIYGADEADKVRIFLPAEPC